MHTRKPFPAAPSSPPTARWRKLAAPTRWLEPAWVGLALTAVSNAWLMTLLAFGLESPEQRNPALAQWELVGSLALAGVAAAGLAGCAAALNEAFSGGTIRTFPSEGPAYPRLNSKPETRNSEPRRPGGAMAGAMLSLVAATAAAVLLGPTSALLCLLAGAGLVFYQLAGRFFPAVGVIGAALLHAVIMLIPNPKLAFAWPILLTVTHVMGCAVLRRSATGRRPRLTAADGWMICLGWAFVSLLLVGLMSSQGTLASGVMEAGDGMWVGPAMAAAGFVAVAIWALPSRRPRGAARQRAAQRFAWISGLWLIMYDASWLLSAGLTWQGLLLGLLAMAVVLTQVAERLRLFAATATLAYRLER